MAEKIDPTRTAMIADRTCIPQAARKLRKDMMRWYTAPLVSRFETTVRNVRSCRLSFLRYADPSRFRVNPLITQSSRANNAPRRGSQQSREGDDRGRAAGRQRAGGGLTDHLSLCRTGRHAGRRSD